MSDELDVGLHNILAEPDLVLIFRDFLKESLSSENLAFIIEVENFKDLWSNGASPQHITIRANEIYNKYFKTSSDYELNVPGPLLEELREKMKTPSSTIFNRIQLSIFKLMESDSYPRFIKSQLYKQYQEDFKKGKKAKPKRGLFSSKKKINDPVTRLREESQVRTQRSGTVSMLEKFFEARPSRDKVLESYTNLSKGMLSQ